MSIKLDDVQRGYDAWAAMPHNAKWVRKIDGTPIPNDIVVNIFDALRDIETDTISLTREEVAILLRAPNFDAYEKVAKRLTAFDRSPSPSPKMEGSENV